MQVSVSVSDPLVQRTLIELGQSKLQ